MPKTVKTTPEKEKNIFQRAFDRLPEGLKNFIRTIRDVAVSITNRVIFGNKQAERLRKADVDEILRKEKEEREQLGSDDKDISKDTKEKDTKEDKEEIEELLETEEWLAGFAGVTDIKELSERLTEAGVPHRLVESEGQPNHIVCQNPTTEQIAQIGFIKAQMDEQGRFVSERTGEVIDDVAIWGESNEGLLEFTVLNKDAAQLETRYVSSAVAFEVLNEAYENSKEKSVEIQQSAELTEEPEEDIIAVRQETELMLKEKSVNENVFLGEVVNPDDVNISYYSSVYGDEISVFAVNQNDISTNADIPINCQDTSLLDGIEYQPTKYANVFLVNSKDISTIIPRAIDLAVKEKEADTLLVKTYNAQKDALFNLQGMLESNGIVANYDQSQPHNSTEAAHLNVDRLYCRSTCDGEILATISIATTKECPEAIDGPMFAVKTSDTIKYYNEQDFNENIVPLLKELKTNEIRSNPSLQINIDERIRFLTNATNEINESIEGLSNASNKQWDYESRCDDYRTQLNAVESELRILNIQKKEQEKLSSPTQQNNNEVKETAASSVVSNNAYAQAEAEASAQVNTIIVYNAQAYNKALDNAKRTGQDLDIKLADTAFTVEVREGKVQGKEVQFKSKNEKSEKQFRDVIRSKSHTFIEGKENSIALAHGELQIDMKRDANKAFVEVSKGDRVKTLTLTSNESPEQLYEQVQGAIKDLDKAIDLDEPEEFTFDESTSSAKKTLEEIIEDAGEQANGQNDYEYVIPDETNLDDGFFDPRYT